MAKQFVRRECECGHADSSHNGNNCRFCACREFRLNEPKEPAMTDPTGIDPCAAVPLEHQIAAWRNDDNAGYDRAIPLLCEAEAELAALRQQDTRRQEDYDALIEQRDRVCRERKALKDENHALRQQVAQQPHLEACKQVMLDMHHALGVEWGHDPYTRIAALKRAEADSLRQEEARLVLLTERAKLQQMVMDANTEKAEMWEEVTRRGQEIAKLKAGLQMSDGHKIDTRCTACMTDYPTSWQHVGTRWAKWGKGFRICKRCVEAAHDARRAAERLAAQGQRMEELAEAETALTAAEAQQQTFQCKARQTADPPEDCGWPSCGCDPYAEKVLTALEEAAPGLFAIRRDNEQLRKETAELKAQVCVRCHRVPPHLCAVCAEQALEAERAAHAIKSAAIAELWGALCPDCGPDDAARIVQLVIEQQSEARATVQQLRAALTTAIATANEALLDWDADRDSRVGKLLAALAGRSPGYRAEIDTIHAALAALPSQKNTDAV